MSVTQDEYDYLMSQDKVFENLSSPIQLGPAPIQWERRINSLVSKELFLLNFYRGSFELSRYTVNKRYRQTIVLFRYDSGGRHTNPDGKQFEGPHVHLYREGYDDKIAFPIAEINVDVDDPMEKVFSKIMYFCNIKRVPNIIGSMF